ncbi:MAG: hypothetical protein LQ345_002177 [Seirophora villosa]|nr:MAG: hypothetical protein LQ345_002177 [Seirophora villosa]
MPALLLSPRSGFTDTASAKAKSGWNTCMSKTQCKYPAIIGILLAVFLALLALYCALRFLSCCCCDCLSGGRYRHPKKSHRHRYADLANSPYDTAGLQQQQQAPMGTVGFAGGGERPPRYARFEPGEDSLPEMPVYHHHHHHHQRIEGGGMVGAEKEVEVEMEREQRVPMLARAGLDPAPRYEAGEGKDVAYVPYSARAWGGDEKGEEGQGKRWRDV